MKKIFLYLFVILLALCFWRILFQKIGQKFNTPTITETKEETKEGFGKEISLPLHYDLKVPFVPQAPFGLWDELHNNACEEASILLVHYYKKGLSPSKEQADKEIKKMVDFQIKKYGSHKDLTAEETATLAREFFGYKNVSVRYDFSWEELKKEITKGNPVIVPVAGRLLKNPFFRRPGPVYHMLVVRGYTKSEVITNDVGTKRGEGYRYSYQVLDKSIHEWSERGEDIEKGRRAMIVIEN